MRGEHTRKSGARSNGEVREVREVPGGQGLPVPDRGPGGSDAEEPDTLVSVAWSTAVNRFRKNYAFTWRSRDCGRDLDFLTS